MDFLKFLASKLFWRNFALAILISVIVLIFAFIFLRIYTRHGQALSVPDLRGLSIAETKQVLESKRMTFQIIDSVYNNAVAPGCVVEQNPPADFKVKENRTIFLTINAFNPEMVLMPNVMGISLRQAQAIIETAGLVVGRLNYVPDIAVNNVLEQKFKGKMIESGDSVPKGAKIDLTVGRGLSDEKTVAPYLLGMDLEDAINKITSRYLNVGAIIYDSSIVDFEDSLYAFIWKQRPVYDEETMISLGSTVDVWLTADSTKLPADTLNVRP
jgi:eukaryotic-like serine/threonine-protein kinase